MKTEVLDILMYLFETYLDDADMDLPNEESIRSELLGAGFNDAKVSKAFDWLDELAILKNDTSHSDPLEANAFRMFSSLEIKKIDLKSRGILIHLSHMGIITPGQRELIIDKALALDSDFINEEQIKWVVLMVLFNLPENSHSYSWFQDLFDDTTSIH